MGLKYTVETIGELRKVLANVPSNTPFRVRMDGCDWDKMEVQSYDDGKPECFVKFKITGNLS